MALTVLHIPERGIRYVRGIRLHRLLKLIALLKGPSSYNARRLGEHFGISRRNVYRDLAILTLAGIPYSYDPDFGTGGGYRIRADFWLPNVGLTDQECFDLAVLTRAAESSNIPLLGDAATVRDKLLATLPAKQQDLIREASHLFDVLSLHLADHRNCRKIMTVLQTALLKHQQVSGVYRTPHECKTVKVELQPRQVFLAGQVWYLAAQDNADRKTKLYRLPRFKELKLLDRAMTIERSFSLRELLGNGHESDRVGYRNGSNGQRYGSTSGNGNGRSNGERGLTQAQGRAITNMARKLGISLDDWLEDNYAVQRIDRLTLKQASEAIDQLKRELTAQEVA